MLKNGQTYFKNLAVLATYLTSNAKMISLCCFFFVFIIFFISHTQMEKKYMEVIDDDIYSRIIEFKANNEIIIAQELQ